MVNSKYLLLNESLNAIHKGSINLLCLSGSAGFGKSYDTLKYLEENKTDYAYLNTYSSPLAFYNSLYLNKDKKIIVFDDVQNLDNNIIISILKSACWGVLKNKRVVGWRTTSESFNKLEIPEEFELNANIILIFNDELKGFEPIINRSVNIEFNFNFNEKIQIFEELKLDKEIIDYIKTECNEATENLSIRTIVILTKLKNDGFKWKDFAKEMLKADGEKDLVLSVLSNCQVVKDACFEWMKATGRSESSFYRIYRKLKGGMKNG